MVASPLAFLSFAIHERSVGSSSANIERAEDRHLNAEDAMLRPLTNESSGRELDTLKFWMLGSDSGQLTLDDESLALEAALTGTGFAYLADWWVDKSVREGKLRLVPNFPGISQASDFTIYYPVVRDLSGL
jgi:DNA-binding transcriptional LysR family regulator